MIVWVLCMMISILNKNRQKMEIIRSKVKEIKHINNKNNRIKKNSEISKLSTN